VKAAIRDGKRPNGQQISPQMPYGFYKIFTPADLDAVVAYMQSIPPVSRKVEPPVYKVKNMVVDIPPGAAKPLPEGALKDPVKRGFYLATIGHCMECHTPMDKGHRDFKNALGTGGEKFEGPWASPCRATSRRTRRSASARGATTRSSAPSPRACARTARRCARRWVSTGTRR